MLILPGALPVAPIPEQAFAMRATQSKTNVVEGNSNASKSRNQTNLGAGAQGGQSQAILKPPPDPDRPTGPPPSFEANLLESERDKAQKAEFSPNDTPQKETAPIELRYEPPPTSIEREMDIAV